MLIIEGGIDMKIYRIYTEETELILNDTWDEETQTTIKYVDSFEKVYDFIDNCHIREDVYYEEIEVE